MWAWSNWRGGVKANANREGFREVPTFAWTRALEQIQLQGELCFPADLCTDDAKWESLKWQPLPKSTISSELCDRFSNGVHQLAARLHGDLLTPMISVVFASDPERFISLGFPERCISLWAQILLKCGADFSLSTLAQESTLLQQLLHIQANEHETDDFSNISSSWGLSDPGAPGLCVHVLTLQNCRQAGCSLHLSQSKATQKATI